MTVQRRARRRSMVGALVAVAAAVTLSACAGQPGAAAVVNGTAISGSDVHTAYQELSPYFTGATTANVLSVLVEEPTVTALAAEQGVGVSPEDAQALLDSVVKEATPDEHPTFSEPSLAIARYSVAYTNLQKVADAEAVSTELAQRISALDVTVNPRFGTLGKGNAIGEPTTPAWIVAPTPAPSDAPAPTPTPTP